MNLKSRVTYSVITRRLHDGVMRAFIERELDSIGLAHSTFTAGATELIVRSADGVLRKRRNLCLASMLEAVRASAGTTIDIDLVNRVLLQPHWQNEVDLTDFQYSKIDSFPTSNSRLLLGRSPRNCSVRFATIYR